jgi:putative transposase
MPSKYTVKTYAANSYYHLYNRGVEKRIIFPEEPDFIVLFSYLKTYLLPKDTFNLQSIISNPNTSYKDKDIANKQLRLNNFSDSIKLLSFCLMPNHYHMLIWQSEENAIDKFMNSLWTRYTMYFNHKYKRVGPLFQDVYKAVLVNTNEQLLYLSKYIHRNPIAKRHLRNLASQGDALRGYLFSSYQDYIGLRQTNWIDKKQILSFWNNNQVNSYENFVLEENDDTNIEIIKSVII